jgi:hypothetical protein
VTVRLGRVAVGLTAIALAVGAAGCHQPGTPAPPGEAAKLDVATSRMSVACGYAAELRAYGNPHPPPPGLSYVESIAVSGARKLASVYAHDQTDLYQGESVGAIVNDSISLLGDCRLPGARSVLEGALAAAH